MAATKYLKQVEQQLKKYREHSPTELNKQLPALRREQLALRVQRAMGQVKSDQFTKVRRNIARLKTVQSAAARGARATGSKA